MKILIFGAEGFIGRAVTAELADAHEVFRAVRHPANGSREVQVDLTERSSIAEAIKSVEPDAIINCAGIVDSSADVSLNTTFTSNILEEVRNIIPAIRRVVIIGSAGEYGVLDERDLPVREDNPKRANSGYGASKAEETRVAQRYREAYGIPVVVARVFNPIGRNMHPKFLTSRIQQQLAAVTEGRRTTLEVSRLDSSRDYVDVRDVARAIKLLVEGYPAHGVYNVGSGRSTSNGVLIDLIVRHSKIVQSPSVIQSATEKEPTVASQADISRIKDELGWSPQYSLEESIKEMTDDTK